MDLKKKYNDLVNKVLMKRIQCYDVYKLDPINENAVIYKNRYYYYTGMLRTLLVEAYILGIKLDLSWRNICPEGRRGELNES